MATTKLTGTLIRSGSIPTTALGGGVISSSVQINSSLPGGVVSSSTQVQSLLPDGAVSSSGQVALSGITGTTFATANFTFPQNLTVGGTLTAQEIQTEYVTSSIIYESGSTKFGDTADDTHQFTGSLSVLGIISGTLALPDGTVSSSAQVVGPGASGRLAVFTGTNAISSSRIVELENGHVGIGVFDPSTRLHVLGTISSSEVHIGGLETGTIVSVDANKQLISKQTTGTGNVVLAGSPTLTGTLTAANITATGSLNVVGTISGSLILPEGVVSSSTQVQTLLPAGTISSSTQINVILDLDQVVSSSGQIKELLPNGTISSSAQFNELTNTSASFATTASAATSITFTPATASFATTASYVTYTNIDGKPELVSSSAQIDITSTTNYTTFSSSIATKNDLQDVSIGALNAATSSYALKSQLDGVASSSSQVKDLLPDGTVSASAQYAGWVTSSNQIALSGISGNTFSSGDFTFPQNLTVSGSLITVGTISGSMVGMFSSSGQVSYTGLVNIPLDIVSSSAQYPGWVTASNQVDVRTTTGVETLATTGSNTFTATQTIIGNLFLSSSFPLVYNNSNTNNMLFGLFDGTTIHGAYYQTFGNNYSTLNQRGGAEFVYDIRNNSGANFHIASFNGATWTEKFRIDDNGAHITGSLESTGGITGSLFGTASLATTASFALATAGTVQNADTASYVTYSNVDGKPELISSSVQVDITSTTNYSTFSSSIATKNDLQDVSITALNAATSSYAINTTIQSQIAGVVSSSTQVKPLLPDGTVSSSAQYPGWVTASSQIDYNSITNKLSDVVSSSAQVQPLLPGGTVSSSGQVSITSTTGYSTFSSSIATKNDIQDISINALSAATSSYAINATIQGQLANVVSSSTQIKPLLPGGILSSSDQYPGWVTASSQIDYNSITNKLSGVYSSSAFTSPSQGTAQLTLNGVALTDVDLGLQTTDTPTFAGVSSSNHITPSADNTYNLGSPEKRWANVYTGDLVLSNEGSSGNNVDGTTGNWTIQEGEEHLYIINNKSGKKFRFMLVEIN